MRFRDVLWNVRRRVRQAQERARDTGRHAGEMVKSIADLLSDERTESFFRLAREHPAPETKDLPVDFQLRQSGVLRRLYERVFPVSHVFKVTFGYGREFLEDFMPLSNEAYIGRGSYKFVYRLPWRMVLKVSKEVLPSDPIFGSLFREVNANQERFLSREEIELQEFLCRGVSSHRAERIRFKFNRLGLERYHYWKVREALPELVLPTKFFMGIRYRSRPFSNAHFEKLTPMDSQIMLAGKHLKEFASSAHKSRGGWWSRFSPRFDFIFESERFGRVKKKVLLKITEDIRRLIRYTELLALKEKLILDIHSENIIITLPEFELKIFDFHLFDEHLYEPSLRFERPEKDHIDLLEKFVESLDLEK